MDYEKKIRILVSENEFLQTQMEDLNREIARKEEEIQLLAGDMESDASIRSKTDIHQLEIIQLKATLQELTNKAAATDVLKDELEHLLKQEIKKALAQTSSLKELDSIKVNMGILNDELNEAAMLYKSIQLLKAELGEAKSTANLKEQENEDLKAEIAELKELIKIYKLKNNG